MFFVLMSEVYPDKVRGRAMSLTNGVAISFNFIITLVFLTEVNAIGGGTCCFGLFCSSSLFSRSWYVHINTSTQHLNSFRQHVNISTSAHQHKTP